MDLKKIVKDAGGSSSVARAMSLIIGARITKQAVWSWINILNRIPAGRVIAFASVVKMQRYEIRPDIYPKNLK